MAFGPKKKAPNPVNVLREHVSTFMYWVKLGKSQFRNKEEIGAIFREMESAKYLFDQATSGTVYDYQKKLERNVWGAAMQKYGEELGRLKEAMLRAADACEARKTLAEKEAAEKAKKEKERLEEEESKLSLREQMERADARAAEEEEEETSSEIDEFEADAGAMMTEADCRELWKIYQNLQGEYRWMKKTADRWIEENPESGCLAAVLAALLVPVGAACALFHFL